MQFYIGMIRHCAEEISNISIEFKKKTLLRELFNHPVDDNLSVDLSEEQFEKIAISFNDDREPMSNPWEHEDGSPAPSESEDPDHEEMEDGLVYQEAHEFQDPDVQGVDGPSRDYEDDVLAPEDGRPAPPEFEDPEHEVMDVEQEEEEQVPMSDEEIKLQFYIGLICHCAEEIPNTSFEFKKKTLVCELFNSLVDDNLSVDLTEEQFEKIAISFDADQEHIEELFAFFQTEKKFLDNLDRARGVFEDPRITEIINNIMAEVQPSIENPEDENFLKERLKILKMFYQITVKKEIEIRTISRQKRHLAAYLGLMVTEMMDYLMEWELRNRPKDAPAPNKEVAAVKFVNSRLKKTIAENEYEYYNGLSKVTFLFRKANNHVSKRMSHSVKEAYRTAFLTLLYKEIARELTDDEVTVIGKWIKMKDHVDYIRRKEKQFFEEGRITMTIEEEF